MLFIMFHKLLFHRLSFAGIIQHLFFKSQYSVFQMNQGWPARGKSDRYTCLFCKHSRFKTFLQLKGHISRHTHEKPFLCKDCGQEFRAKLDRIPHSRSHNPVRPFKCPLCGKPFKTKWDRGRHLIIHTGECTNVHFTPKNFTTNQHKPITSCTTLKKSHTIVTYVARHLVR